jgi:cyanobactin maturation PatA/PatG family protease
MPDTHRLPGLHELWAETLGDPAITIAVLDGPVALDHPCFEGALLESLPTLVSGVAGNGRMSAHATHIASMIFGQHGGVVPGIAPWCRGLIVPIYSDASQGPTSQMDLARAINQAVDAGAQVINISGGELSPGGEADPMLANAVRNCYDEGVLIVAAAGNDGCRCLHVPAALPTVLAVGAADDNGLPLDCSNWGDAYQTQGVLAPGLDMVGAAPGGAVALKTGTSVATPVVTGVVGLLLSLQRQRGMIPEPHAVRAAILSTAIPCNGALFADCSRFLVGRLNIPGAHAWMSQAHLRRITMPDERISSDGVQPSDPAQLAAACSSGVVAQEDQGSPVGAVQPAVGGEDLGSQVSHVPPSEPGIIAGAARVPVTARARQPATASSPTPWGSTTAPAVPRHGVIASDGCSCKSTKGDYIDPVSVGTRPPVFALGVLGYDFGTEARRDTFKALMPHVDPNGGFPFFPPPPPPKDTKPPPPVIPFPPNPYDPLQMVNYLAGYPRPRPPFPSQGGYDKRDPKAFPDEIPPFPPHPKYPGLEASPWDAAELIWTVNIELTPIYAIRPAGGFAAEVYQRLVQFLDGQVRNPDDDEHIERVSIPGFLSGETVTLFSGQVVPVLVPTLRGMFGWSVNQLIDLLVAKVQEKYKKLKPEDIKAKGLPSLDDAINNVKTSLRNFLDRIYYDLRNLGQTPAERALNFSATNAFQAAEVFTDPASAGMQLDCIKTERSPFCRKDSDCWDVKLRFFDPENDRRARLVSRYTVDVSDVFPVTVGPVRTWSESGLPCY